MGAPQKAGPGPAFVARLGYVYLYTLAADGRTWTYNGVFDPPHDRSINRLFGLSIAISVSEITNGTRLLIGSPGAAADDLTVPNAGVAFLYQGGHLLA